MQQRNSRKQSEHCTYLACCITVADLACRQSLRFMVGSWLILGSNWTRLDMHHVTQLSASGSEPQSEQYLDHAPDNHKDQRHTSCSDTHTICCQSVSLKHAVKMFHADLRPGRFTQACCRNMLSRSMQTCAQARNAGAAAATQDSKYEQQGWRERVGPPEERAGQGQVTHGYVEHAQSLTACSYHSFKCQCWSCWRADCVLVLTVMM